MKNIVLIAIVLSSFTAKSQDMIKTIYGDEIKVKLTEITKEEVKYKKADDVNDANYSMRIVIIEKITFEDGTVKEFGGTLDLVENEDEVLFKKKDKAKEKDKKKLITSVDSGHISIPENILNMAKKGSKVFLQSRDNNAAIHAKNYINEWGFWEVTPDAKTADLILKLNVRFQGPMHFFVSVIFIDSQTNNELFTTEEFLAQKGNKDPNKKRAAVKHLVDAILTSNFK